MPRLRVSRRWRPWLEAVRGAFSAGRRAYQARLAASEARFEAAAESLLDGLAIFDAEDRLVYHNGRYPEHLAAPLRATLALGKRWPDWLAEAERLGPLYHPEMGEGFAELRLRERREPACDREFRLADGRWLRVREGRMPDGGRVQLSADVTARKEAEARLRASEQRFLAAAESIPDGLLILDAEDRIAFHNSRHPEHLPASLREVLRPGVRFEDWIREGEARGPVYHPDMGPGFTEWRLARRRSERGEHEHKHADGRWVRIREARTPDGGRVLLTTDVTEARRQRRALARKTRQLEAVLAGIAEGVTIVDARGRVVLVNEGFLRFYGFPRELAAPGTPLEAFVEHRLRAGALRPEERDGAPPEALVARRVRELLAFRGASTFEEETPDGRVVLVRRERLEGDGLLVSTYEDVTERRRAERALKESEELLRAIVDDQTELVCRFDADFRLVFSNKAHARLFGLTPEGIAGLDLFEGVPERLRAGLRAELLALTPERPVHLGVNEKVTAQGEVRWFEWVNRALFDASGRRVGLQAVGRDVTEQHLAEAALRASEARYRAVVEAQTEFVLRMSAEGRPTLVNDAYCRYVGQSREELLDPARGHLENVAPDDRPRYEAHLRSLTLERPSAGIELRARLPDGRIRWEQWTDTGVFDGEGRLAEVQSVGRDVTERREAERRLVESEARYRAVVEGQTEFILRLRPDGTLTFVNDAYCRYRGLPREVLLAGFDDVAHYPEAQQARVRAAWAGLSPERPAVAYGLEEPRADDGPRWQEWTDTGIFDAEGRLAEVQAVGRDVTERRRAEVALKESEELLRAIVDDQTEVISRFDAGFRLVFCNLAFARLFFDRTPVEALGACLFDLVPEQIRDDLRARLLALTPERPALRATGERLLPGGGVRRLEWVNRALFDASGRRVGLQAVGRDVTEQHLAEAALRASEARFAAFMEHAPVGMYLKDLDGRYTMLNPEMAKVFGRPVGAMLGGDPAEVFSPEEVAVIRHFDREVVERGEPTRHEEHMPGLDAYAWSLVIRFPVRDAAGTVTHIGGFDVDVTAQKRALAELEASEQRFRAIALSHPTPMMVARLADKKAVFANEAFLATFRLDPGLLPTYDRDRLYADPTERAAMFAEVAALGRVENRELVLRRADGEPFPAMLTARAIAYEGDACAVVSFQDLSALKAAEALIARQRDALHQSEKLTALGSLLAGVAHELNNPLSVVTGYAEMLRDLAPDAATRARAERVHGAAERCARIVKTFLAMARQRPPQRGPVALPKAIEGALELAAYGLRSAGVAVETDLPPGLPPAWGDADQLHQVLVNLVVNAQQALLQVAPPRRLAVRARAVDDGGRAVVVEVEDNGPGMPPEVVRRVFEPFFTTKPQGAGTGIGLSVCHGIVAAHGGRIEVVGHEGDGGTLFRVTLPAVPAAGADDGTGPDAPAPAPPTAPAARGRVLVVDDEPEIAELVAETLRREEGLEAETAPSGSRALARLERGGIDLVVSDLRMPDLDGAALAEALRVRHPALASRLVLMTGDALRARAGETGTAAVPGIGAPVVLEKPLDLAALRRVVRRMLDEDSDGGRRTDG